jgi:type II secretory ATPase GspE/PulE/Tfp pilus assembly ATPase PilB-like protein
MCDLDISERRKPQDGKINFKKFGPLDIELRVATCPPRAGRGRGAALLAAGEPMPLEKLGLSPHNLAAAAPRSRKPYGLSYVVRPHGSARPPRCTRS